MRKFGSHAVVCVLMTLCMWLISSCSAPPAVQEQAQKELSPVWVELGPDSQVIARTLSWGTTCPQIQLDSTRQPMTIRAGSSDFFPGLVCEAQIPPQTQSAKIGEALLPLPKQTLKRMVILGDTGCRVKINKQSKWVQACNDPNSWPLLKVTRAAAQWKPDLVIHVGDYLYRESPCPEGQKGCAGSPWGDRWETWRADFFGPAAELLAAAPWVFVRGNHELCKRAGQGWFRLLDPRPLPQKCEDHTDSYSVQAAGVKLFVLDSANAEDNQVDMNQVKEFASQFRKMEGQATEPSWILTHRPIWAAAGNWDTSPHAKPLLTLNQTLQKSAERNLSPNLKLILSGHIHLFEALTFSDSGPSQFVLGNGGTELSEVPTQLTSVEIGTRSIREGVAIHDFGYMTLELESSGQWQAIAYSPAGKVLQKCKVQGSRLDCH